ncbi:MAG: DNA primase DnaG [Candidatus Nanoarchaeia archaeon]
MGKVSPVSAKYIIDAAIQIEGSVDKPDVIGAIFGQTEGFLGSDLELRELQRSGKIGRIEVKLDPVNGKSVGHIIIPSSLDKAETAIIAAALETIDRIGPCNSHVHVDKIEDVRIAKRSFVIQRAKELLQQLQSTVLPDSQEITEEVAQSVRVLEVTEWGPERLPAGPGVNESEEVILVEGRADVLNLLKQGIKNTVAMNGTSVPESVKELCKQKVVTAFVDGDRGGDLILRELIATSELDYITKAPDGKEVEELTKKEVHIALRAKVAAEQFKFEVSGAKKPQLIQQGYRKASTQGEIPPQRSEQRPELRIEARPMNREGRDLPPRDARPMPKPEAKKDYTQFREKLYDLVGTRGAYILDKECKILGKVPSAELETTLQGVDNIFAVVFDGSITKEIAQAAEESKVSYVVATASKIKPTETKVRILTQKDLE